MLVAKQNRVIRTAPFVAACFCLLSMAQVVRPVRSIGPNSSAGLAAPLHHLTCHALQEVSPRNGQPRAPFAVGLVAVAAVIQHGLLPRMAAYVPLWPMVSWPIHRRVAPASADNPEPA